MFLLHVFLFVVSKYVYLPTYFTIRHLRQCTLRLAGYQQTAIAHQGWPPANSTNLTGEDTRDRHKHTNQPDWGQTINCILNCYLKVKK